MEFGGSFGFVFFFLDFLFGFRVVGLGFWFEFWGN